MDNRPLKFDEFEAMQNQFMCQQLLRITNKKTEGVVVASHSTYRVIRSRNEIRPSLNQIDDLIEEIQIRAEIDERVLVTTLTKKEWRRN
jgi:excinuclease ABC subunit B